MNKDQSKNITSMFSMKGLNPKSIKKYQQKLEKHNKVVERKI